MEVEVAPEPIMMEGVRAMIWAMMAEQREEMRKILLHNRDEHTILVEQPKLDEGQLEEWNYSMIVSQAKPPVVRRNNQDERIERNECKYKDFTNCK